MHVPGGGEASRGGRRRTTTLKIYVGLEKNSPEDVEGKYIKNGNASREGQRRPHAMSSRKRR